MSCTSVLADVRDPDYRNIRPLMSFAGVDDHPDHVFLILVEDSPSVPLEGDKRVIPIPGPKPFAPGFQRRIRKVTILAVPKAEYEKARKDGGVPFDPESPSVLACEIPRPPTELHIETPDPGVLRYRVVIDKGELRVTRAPAENRDPSSAVPRRSRMAWWGIALAASITWLGIVVGRRLVRGS
jgi:hypothetical protein